MNRTATANGKAGSDLERELRKVVEGDVRFDDYSRLLYATDASMYQVEPIGVVLPRSAADVHAVLELANRYNVPVLPRGGGTSLAGQAVNHAVVLDFSRYMNRVLEVDKDGLWCRVQPGLVQDELNAHVRPMGLLFGPDTSTSNRATIGGMCGNNSAGSHSIAYGKTLDHVLELTCLLADGSEVVLRDLTPDELEAKSRGDGLEGQIYREVRRLVGAHADEIRARYPRIMRRVSGYNLDEFLKSQPFGLHRLAVGSEGTLVVVVEMKMRLVPKPKHTALDVIHYRTLEEALESSPDLLTTGPYAVELTDKMILDLARDNFEQRPRMGFVQGDPAAIMIVEYAGESDAEVRAKVEALERLRARKRMGYAAHQAFDAAEQQSIWKLRKAGLGLLLGLKGDKKPIAFVEDTAVDPAKLPAFIARFREILGAPRRGRRVLRPLLGGVPPHPAADQPQGRRRDPEDAADRRGDHRAGARVRGRALGRARRRPGPEPVQRDALRPAALRRLPPGQARVRPQGHPEPRQHRGQPADDRVPPLRGRLQDVGAGDPARLLGAGRLRGGRRDVQRHRRLPEEARGHHVPLVHGHARRGALDPRPGQRAARRAVGPGPGGGLHGPAALRGARPVPGVQGVQGGVPGQRGHGQAQVRVPGPLLPGQRPAAPEPALRPHPPPRPLGLGAGAPLQLAGPLGAAPLAARAAGRDRPPPAAARVRRDPVHVLVRPSPGGGDGRAGRGRALPRHLQHLPDARGGHRGDAAPGGDRLPGGPARPAVLRAADDLEGAARRGPGPGRVQRRAAGRSTRGRAGRSSGSSPRAS